MHTIHSQTDMIKLRDWAFACRWMRKSTHLHIHSFSHFYSAPSSPLLLRGAPDYNTDTVSEFHAEAHRQL